MYGTSPGRVLLSEQLARSDAMLRNVYVHYLVCVQMGHITIMNALFHNRNLNEYSPAWALTCDYHKTPKMFY